METSTAQVVGHRDPALDRNVTSQGFPSYPDTAILGQLLRRHVVHLDYPRPDSATAVLADDIGYGYRHTDATTHPNNRLSTAGYIPLTTVPTDEDEHRPE